MTPVAPRTVGLAVAVAASLAAAAGLAVGALARPFHRPARPRSGEFGIHNVPRRPPLWDAHPAARPTDAIPDVHEVSPVPAHDNHAPASR